jgi:hypothetical protein
METPEDKDQGTNTPQETSNKLPAAKAPVKKPAVKKAKGTTNNKGTKVKPTIGHDPKNRHVYLEKKGEKFKVSKPATGFVFEGSEKKAKEAFEHQKLCSHN